MLNRLTRMLKSSLSLSVELSIFLNWRPIIIASSYHAKEKKKHKWLNALKTSDGDGLFRRAEMHKNFLLHFDMTLVGCQIFLFNGFILGK